MPSAILRRLAPRALLALAAGIPLLVASAAPVLAQSTCQEFGKTLNERKTLIQRISEATGKNKKLEPKAACSMFGNLVENGSAALKWLEANKDWCQIPEAFVENIRKDHEQAVSVRGKACKAAAQQAALEKKARQQQGSGLLGGDGLTGSYKIPQGAL